MRDFLRNHFRIGFVLVGLLFAAIIDSSALWIVSKSYTWTNDEARRELESLGLTLGEQTDQTMKGVELVQNSIAHQLGFSALLTAQEFEEKARSYDFHRAMKDRLDGLPHIDALTIIDRKGDLLNFSRYWPIPAVNVSDRDYFQALSTQPALTTYVSSPVQNRGDGRWTVYIARKVSGEDGAFLGAVLVALNLDYFESFYESLSLGPASTVALFKRNGELLARYPRVDRSVIRPLNSSSMLFRETLAHSDHGTVRQISPIDGMDRFVSARALARYPIVVTVSTHAEQVFEGWQRGVTFLAVTLVFFNLLIAAAVLLCIRQMKSYARTSYMARHDALTNLPNRFFLRERINAAILSGQPFSLAVLDLDNFKTVNDLFGHAAGDNALREVSRTLQETVDQKTDFVARLGGDEFAILRRPGDMGEICDAITATLRRTFDQDGRSVAISTCIGVASSGGNGDADEILRRADMALYAAKAEGRDAWRRFDLTMEKAVLDEQNLEAGLRVAIARDELALYLQPIVDPESHEPIGFEALLRWLSPDRGLVSPADFIPVAESTGLIVPIGEWVLKAACREAASWSRPLTVSVNLSSLQITSGDIVGTVFRALQETRLPAWRLELEVTESVLLRKNDTVLRALHAIRVLGVRIAIDDFGTGYSSLGSLVNFPFDRIKIDRSFVRKITIDPSSMTVVRAILALAKSLGLEVTTEGVETAEQLDAVRKAGSTAIQGFYYDRPKPAAEVGATYGLTTPAPLGYSRYA